MTSIYANWNSERSIRQWESWRLRGHEYLARSNFNAADSYFKRSKISAINLGKNNFRYAISLADLAKVDAKRGDFESSRKNLGRAISILDRQTPFELRSHFPLYEDQILLNCQLVNLDLQSGKGIKKAWQDCQRGLQIYFEQKPKSIDPIVSRTICQTLSAIGDEAYRQGNNEVLGLSCMKTSEIASLQPEMKGLVRANQKKTSCPISASNVEKLDELVTQAQNELNSHELAKAKETLAKAEVYALAEDERLRAQFSYLKGRVAYIENDFENAEKEFQSIVSNAKTIDKQTVDDAYSKLSIIYKHCGLDESAIETFKQQRKVRQEMYGANNEKVIDMEVELAKLLQDNGRSNEASEYIEHARKSYLDTQKEGVGNLGASSERLGYVLLFAGDKKTAKSIFETIIQQYEEGMKKKISWIAFTCFDLAGMYELDGNHKEAMSFFNRAQELEGELADRDKMGLACTSLKNWAEKLNKKPLAASFIIEAIKFLQLPSDRSEAIRVDVTLEALQKLRVNNPSAFNPSTNKKISQLKNAINKFPKVHLKGLTQ